MRSVCSVLVIFACITLCFPCGLDAGTNPASVSSNGKPASGVQVLYVIQGNTITTYNVDTAGALVPAGVPVATEAPNSGLTPSPDGHFLYQNWADNSGQRHIAVYRTDEAGVPQLPPVQSLDVQAGFSLVHPSGRLAYGVRDRIISGNNETLVSDTYVFNVDPATGKISENPIPVASTSGPSFCWFDFPYGFSVDGTQLYEFSGESCDGLTDTNLTRRQINFDTGGLGNADTVFSIGYSWGDTDLVVIGGPLLFHYFGYPITESFLDVFDINDIVAAAPLIHCTGAILPICQTATDVRAEPMGQYLFMLDAPPTPTIHLVRVSLLTGTLIDVYDFKPEHGSYPDIRFSPDGSVAYVETASDGTPPNFYVTPYLLSRDTGTVATSGMPFTTSAIYDIATAVRRR